MRLNCIDCKFYCSKFNFIGECRRHPPILIVHEEQLKSEWPEVHPEEWCGEFEEQVPL